MSNTIPGPVPESLLGKVRALLTHAEDPACTPAEAEAFNAKAAELIARYGIEAALLADTGQRPDQIGRRTLTIDNPYRRDKAHLLTRVADPLRCRTVHRTSRYHPYRVDLFGYSADLERVELLFTSLLVQATTQLVRITPPPDPYYGLYGRESTAAYRRSWLAGFTDAIARRLDTAEAHAARTQPATDTGTSTALVLADRKTAVDQAVIDAYPRLRTMPARRLSGTGHTDGYHAGTRADFGITRLTDRRQALGR